MKTIVIGGGPAGCTAAYVLRREGHEVTLIEAAHKVGGRTKQLDREGFNLATGALFLMGGIYPRTMALLDEMKVRDQLVPWGGAAQLMDEDDARYPVSFVKLQTYFSVPKLTLGDRLRLARAAIKLFLSAGAKNAFDGSALAKYDVGDNLEAWSRRELGDRPYEYIVRPIMDFLYAVPASWLSTPFPIAIIQQALKMQLSVPPKGVGQVSEWLVDHTPGLNLHVSTPVEKIERIRETSGSSYRVHAGGKTFDGDGLVVATPAYVTAELMQGLAPDSAVKKLAEAPYTDYAHVAVAWKKSPWPNFPADIVLPVGFGGVRNIGSIVLHSRRNPGSVPPGGEAVGVYFNTPPLAHMSDDDIQREAVAAAMQAFGKAPEPDFVHLFHYDRGLSIAKPGHYGTLDSVHKEMPPNVFLAGDYFSQAGVEAAVFSGEQAAMRLMGQV